jgi:hypothetical protein
MVVIEEVGEGDEALCIQVCRGWTAVHDFGDDESCR